MSSIYRLVTPADALPFITRLNRAIRRKEVMTIEYREMKRRPDGTRSRSEMQTVMRTVEPWALEMTQDGVPIMRAMCRTSGEPRTYRLDRIRNYSVSRTHRLVPEYVPVNAEPDHV